MQLCPSPSPTLTPPFPLPPADSEDPDPVEALLQLAAAANSRAQCSLSSSGSAPSAGTQAQVNPVTGEQESDEGIVSDQSNEFEDKKVGRFPIIDLPSHYSTNVNKSFVFV